MKLRITDVKNSGQHDEHIVVQCKEDTSLGIHMLMKVDSHLNVLQCIWLPDVQIEEGNVAHIFTISTLEESTLLDKYISLGKSESLWNDLKNKYSIVLMECKDWRFGYYQ